MFALGARSLSLCLAVALMTPAASGQALAREPDATVEAGVQQTVARVLDRLDAAWDAMDGRRFAGEFTDDADVINVNGSRFSGRADLARQMQFLFDGRFRGSRHGERVIELTRELAPGLILTVSSARIVMPAGAPTAEMRSRQSFILQKSGEAWLIRHWHNTPIREVREGAPVL